MATMGEVADLAGAVTTEDVLDSATRLAEFLEALPGLFGNLMTAMIAVADGVNGNGQADVGQLLDMIVADLISSQSLAGDAAMTKLTQFLRG